MVYKRNGISMRVTRLPGSTETTPAVLGREPESLFPEEEFDEWNDQPARSPRDRPNQSKLLPSEASGKGQKDGPLLR